MILSVGESKTRCSASVSSITPRFGARWPAFRATVWMMTWRISAASLASWALSRPLRSAGEWMFSSMLIGASSRCSWMVDPVPEDGAAHAENGSHEHLERRVAQELHELLGLLLRVLEL